MTAPSTMAATIPHAAKCGRPAPVPRLSWRGTPEWWCPCCGRYARVAQGVA